jgi:hypothetical protein
MQEKQALAQIRDAQHMVSILHLENLESVNRSSAINQVDPVHLDGSATDHKPPTMTDDEPASRCSGSEWVYFAGVCPAECSDPESDAKIWQPPLVSTGGARPTAGAQV